MKRLSCFLLALPLLCSSVYASPFSMEQAGPLPITIEQNPPAELKAVGKFAFDPNAPMSMTEKDNIMSQIARCWLVPAGVNDKQDLVVTILTEYNPDGSLKTATIARKDDAARAAADAFFRGAADSALRAVQQCSPLRNMPKEKYESWRHMELTFDPKFLRN